MSEIDRYLEQYPNLPHSVGGYAVRNNQIWLGLRKKVSNNLGLGLISGIGGKLEKGENHDQALIREFLEETITMKPTSFRKRGYVTFFFANNPILNQIVTFYLIDNWEGEPQETVPIKPILFDIKSIPFDHMWEDNFYIIPPILEEKFVKGVVLYGADGQIKEHTIKAT